MLRTLYSRLALTLFILLGAVGSVLVVIVARASTLYQQETAQQLNHDLADQIAREYRLLDPGGPNQAALDDLFHHLMVINPAIELYLLDADGVILAYSAPPDVVQRERVGLAPIRAFLSGGATAPLRGDDPRSRDGRKVFSAAPVDLDGARQGYLYIVLGGEQFDRVADMVGASYILETALVILFLALFAALLAGLLVFARLTRRLRCLSRVMRDYAVADSRDAPRPRYPARFDTPDEIDTLGRQFNTMAAGIEQHRLERHRLEEQRRELLANVSHDLRTPLTSLRGYLETLLRQWPQLGQPERQRYLQTALSQCERLNRRVQSLFELARLDACETLSEEAFSMAELVQDVSQGHALKADARCIHLDVRLNARDAAPVRGDIGLLQRVLDNLLDNAVRHTPHGGRVTVRVADDHGAVRVEVCNTGAAIDDRVAGRLFERYYRNDTGNHPDGAGLGLAIVKRILELHGSRIRVRHDPARGTCFHFALPRFERIKKPAAAVPSAG